MNRFLLHHARPAVQGHRRADVRRHRVHHVADLPLGRLRRVDREVLLVLQDRRVLAEVQQDRPLAGRRVGGDRLVPEVQRQPVRQRLRDHPRHDQRRRRGTRSARRTCDRTPGRTGRTCPASTASRAVPSSPRPGTSASRRRPAAAPAAPWPRGPCASPAPGRSAPSPPPRARPGSPGGCARRRRGTRSGSGPGDLAIRSYSSTAAGPGLIPVRSWPTFTSIITSSGFGIPSHPAASPAQPRPGGRTGR